MPITFPVSTCASTATADSTTAMLKPIDPNLMCVLLARAYPGGRVGRASWLSRCRVAGTAHRRGRIIRGEDDRVFCLSILLEIIARVAFRAADDGYPCSDVRPVNFVRSSTASRSFETT